MRHDSIFVLVAYLEKREKKYSKMFGPKEKWSKNCSSAFYNQIRKVFYELSKYQTI
jgi:hypothetical protein